MSGYLWFILPLFFVGKWSIALSRARGNPAFGIGLFVVTAAIIVPICVFAEVNAQSLAAQKLWTAATMTQAAGLLKSGIVLMVCYFVHWLLWPKDNTGSPHDPHA